MCWGIDLIVGHGLIADMDIDNLFVCMNDCNALLYTDEEYEDSDSSHFLPREWVSKRIHPP